jgi:hypothetical protein
MVPAETTCPISADGDAVVVATAALRESGAAVLRGALDAEAVAGLARSADRCYAGSGVPPGVRRAPSASSFGLDVLSQAAAMDVASWIAGNEVIRRTAAAFLGSALCLDLDQAWLRRQYAPQHYPPGHAPHGWHQDGALGFDFLRDDPEAHGALLQMLTCWCPLVACGADAPGLEVLAGRFGRVVPLGQLDDTALRARFAPGQFLVPLLRPGDVLLLAGGVLHRTHVHPGMTADRTSIEVRLLGGTVLPARIANDRSLRLTAA